MTIVDMVLFVFHLVGALRLVQRNKLISKNRYHDVFTSSANGSRETEDKINFGLVFHDFTSCGPPPWRNGLACWTSNSKVVGSSPTGGGIFVIFFADLHDMIHDIPSFVIILFLPLFLLPFLHSNDCS